MPATVRSLDERIDTLVDKLDATSLSAETFKAKADAAFGFTKWGISLISGAVLLDLLQLYAVANRAGKLEASVDEMRSNIGKHAVIADRLRDAVQKEEVVTAELRVAVHEMRESTRRQKAANAKLNDTLEAIAKDVAELKPMPKP